MRTNGVGMKRKAQPAQFTDKNPGSSPKQKSGKTPVAGLMDKNQLLSTSSVRSNKDKLLHLKNLTADQRIKYDVLAARGILPNRYADKQALASIGLLDDVTKLLEGIGWVQLLDFNAPSYAELVYEFLSTFEFKEPGPVSMASMFHFQLMGKPYVLSDTTLRKIFGWYNGYQRDPPEFDEKEFWQTLTTKKSAAYSGRTSKASTMVDPAYRYIYKLFAYTLFGRGSIGPVSKPELTILYCVHKKSKVDFAILFGKRMNEVIAQKDGPIVVGGFVSMIASHLKISDQSLSSLTMQPAKILDFSTLVTMHFIRLSGDRYEIIPPESRNTSSEPVVEPRVSEPVVENNSVASLVNRVAVLEDVVNDLKADIGVVRTDISNLHESMSRQLTEVLHCVRHQSPPHMP